jgi:uncharacterized protein (TIRG00374 family)
VLAGRVIADDDGEAYRVVAPSGDVRIVSRGDVARDRQGAPRVAYGLRSVWHRSDKILLAGGVAVFLAVPLLQGIRLHRLLRAQGIRVGWGTNIRLAFAGNFLNFAAPLGSTAGDVFKAYYVACHSDRRTEAATIVFLDRVLGLAVLLLSVGLIALLARTDSRLLALRPYLLSLIGLLVGAGLLWAASWWWKPAAVRRVAARLPKLDQLRRIDATARAMLAQRRALMEAVGITLVLQTFAALAFIGVAQAVGLRVGEIGFLATYAYFSAGEIVKALPGPPQGLGTMELAYSFFFAGLGSPAQIVASAVAIRLVNLAWALPGIVLLVTGTLGPGTAAAARAPRRPEPELATAA